MGTGISMAQNSLLVMIGQYFKKRREGVEMVLESSAGVGLSVVPPFLNHTVRKLGWRIGLQLVTGILLSVFFFGMFYRSASLYHPQRRAILHLKNQKRKIKCKKEDKKKFQEEQLPLIDLSVLKSRTLRLLILSSSLSCPALAAPIVLLSTEGERRGHSPNEIVFLYTSLGLGWILGCSVFGLLVVRKSSECSIGRQYLCQSSLALCGILIFSLTTVTDYNSYVLFSWIFGFSLGGHSYSLKTYVFEKVRSKRFPWAWGVIQLVQGLSLGLILPLVQLAGQRLGLPNHYYFFSALILLASLVMARIKSTRKTRRRRRRMRQKVQETNTDKQDENRYEEEGEEEEEELPDVDDDFLPPLTLHTQQRSVTYGDLVDGQRPNLACISEEAMEDINFPEKFLEELECLENITSCNKVENYLLFSEFEENLGEELVKQKAGGRVRLREAGRRDFWGSRASWQVPLPKRRVSTIVENSV